MKVDGAPQALATSRPHYLEADDYRRFMRHLDAMQATLAAQRKALGAQRLLAG